MPGDHLLAELEAGPSNAKNRKEKNLIKSKRMIIYN
jgi:hypothetical protein